MLEFEIKSCQSKVGFKNKILGKIRPKKHSYFGLRDNKKVRYLTMLRMNLSPLRAHKKKYNFLDTPHAQCGCEEDTDHFLLRCISYRLARATMFENISLIINVQMLTLPMRRVRSILLYGKDDISDDKNLLISKEVAKFITKSKRFDNT